MRTLKIFFKVGILLGFLLYSYNLSSPSTGSGSASTDSGSASTDSVRAPFPEPVEGDNTAAALELYGTFHAMGVNVDISAADDTDHDATANVAYRTGSNAYQAGFPLSRISASRFSGSLFWLTPGVSYDVRVTLSDPDGGALNGVVLQASASTRTEITIPTLSHTYYVSPSGFGSACSQSVPCTLAYGIEQVKAGEQVMLLGGVYYQGEIEIPSSGNAGAPVVIREMTGQTAILDGGDPQDFSWSHISNGIYQTTVNIANTHLVVANGYRLFPYLSYDDLSDDLWGIPGFFADGANVYVRLAGNADPNDAAMVVSRYNLAFLVEQNFIYIQNLTFQHYGNGDYAKAIYLNNASHNLIQGCIFAINDLGIGVKRASGENVIEYNEFYDTDFDWPWDSFKEYDAKLETGGIRFYSPTTGRGNVIRYNSFHDYFDGFGACPEEAGTESMEYDIYGNHVYNAGDDGMETDGTCSNVRIWNNTFENVLMGISLAPTYIGPTYAIRNLIYNTGVGNNDYSGSPFKFNSGYDKSGPMYLFHNTSDAVLPGNNGLYIAAPGTWDLIYARNNIWAGTEYAINNYNEDQPIDLDYDNLYTSKPKEFVNWGSGENRHMRNLMTFQNLTGQEPHGLNEVPDFFNPTNNDYTPALGSLLIDNGIFIPGINDGYNGTAPDIGAFEYEGNGFELVVQPPHQAIDPGETTAFQISLDTTGSFTDTVSLSYHAAPAGLLINLTPTVIDTSTFATLTVTDTHIAPLDSSLVFTIDLTGSTSAETDTQTLLLLVGGDSFYLPCVLR